MVIWGWQRSAFNLKSSKLKFVFMIVMALCLILNCSAEEDNSIASMVQAIATSTSIQEYKGEVKQDAPFVTNSEEYSNIIANCILNGCDEWKNLSKQNVSNFSEINVHIIPHSHTDAGWIESIDWYYDNWVKNIFKNIFEEMYENKNITFVWADTNYLHQWFETQNKETQQKVFEIIRRGQLEFVGGGWVQNDESLSDLKSIAFNIFIFLINYEIYHIVNQMNLGLQYLHERFNATPTVGWQIDPFGYNNFMPSIFKELGYKYLVLNRIGDQRKENFKNSSNMDFWLESGELGDKNKILTHVLPRHYEPQDYDQLIANIPSEFDSEKNKMEFVKRFFNIYIKEQIKGYKSEEFMMLMGKDFGFNNQRGILGKIDMMNQIVTKYSKQAVGIQINCKFSLPSTYFNVIEESRNLDTKQQDFLNYDERLVYLHPNEDFNKIDYWVGYYFTRPHLKKRIKETFNSFRSLETLVAYTRHIGKFHQELEVIFLDIEKQLSYMLHHDAITGTSRQGTINDYYSRLDKADINQLFSEVNSILLKGASEAKLDSNEDIIQKPVYYYNQAIYKRELIISIPTAYNNIRVYDNQLKKYLECELVNIDSNSFNLYVLIEIGGLTLKTFTLEYSTSKSLDHQAKLLDKVRFDPDLTTLFETDHYILKLSKNSLIESIKSKKTDKQIDINQEFNYYEETNSGIYVFRPKYDKQVLKYAPKDAFVSKGTLIDFITTSNTLHGNVKQKVTIFKKGDTQIAPLVETTSQTWKYAELGFGLNTSNLTESQELYTHDSNEFIKRDFKEVSNLNEIGKNIYPVIHGFAVKDSQDIFGIFNNYPTGCGYIPKLRNQHETEEESLLEESINSKNDKSYVQCFLTRNTNKDDDKGLPDVLDDSKEASFSFFLVVGSTENYNALYQTLSDYFNTPLSTKITNSGFSRFDLDSNIFCISNDKEFVHRMDNKDYFYAASDFTLLSDHNVSKDIELFDIFENHKKESFVRVRNRQSNIFKNPVEDYIRFDLEQTFIFDLERDQKYTMNGIQKIPKQYEKDFIKNAIEFARKGYHFVKDQVLRFDCEVERSIYLKPREVATLMVVNK